MYNLLGRILESQIYILYKSILADCIIHTHMCAYKYVGI